MYFSRPVFAALREPFQRVTCATGPGILTATLRTEAIKALNQHYGGMNYSTGTSSKSKNSSIAITGTLKNGDLLPSTLLGYRLGGIDFQILGAQFKVDEKVYMYEDGHSSEHYAAHMKRNPSMSLLKSYYNDTAEDELGKRYAMEYEAVHRKVSKRRQPIADISTESQGNKITPKKNRHSNVYHKKISNKTQTTTGISIESQGEKRQSSSSADRKVTKAVAGPLAAQSILRRMRPIGRH
jgi:hypothetical protein